MTTLSGRASLGWDTALIRSGFLVPMNFYLDRIP